MSSGIQYTPEVVCVVYNTLVKYILYRSVVIQADSAAFASTVSATQAST